MATAKPKEKPVEKAAPVSVSIESGRINATLKSVGKTFDAQNEGWNHRWVYDPPNAPQSSNVPFRQAEGYRFVDMGEVDGIDLEYLSDEAKGRIRVGDVVLMKIESKKRAEFLKHYQNKADSQLARVGKDFNDEMAGHKVRNREGKEASARPIGNIKTNVVDKEVDIPQRESEV
jgi:hypothetical protein